MRRFLPIWLALVAFATASAPALAQDVDAPGQQQAEVTPDDIVVVGRMPHCRRHVGDPYDAVAPGPSPNQVTIQPDPVTGVLRGVTTREPWITGPDYWQRAGTALSQFVFRSTGEPLCIGGRQKQPSGFAQLRRSQSPVPFRCQYVRFTAFAAWRDADAMFWLNAGSRGTWLPVEVHGSTEGWRPIMLAVGPVSRRSGWIGYGVLLHSGDVWFMQPKLEVIPERELADWQVKNARNCKDRKSRNRMIPTDLNSE